MMTGMHGTLRRKQQPRRTHRHRAGPPSSQSGIDRLRPRPVVRGPTRGELATTMSTNAIFPPTTRIPADGNVPSLGKGEKRASDSIPWPSLSNFKPSNLTKTASHLMAEWERSLISPDSQSDRPSRKEMPAVTHPRNAVEEDWGPPF